MHVAAARRAGLEVLGGWDSDPSVSTAWAQANQRPVFGSLDSALAAGPELAVVTGTPLEMPARLKHVAESGVPVLVETFGGKRYYYFYVAADTDVPAIISAVASCYPEEQLLWTVRPDPQWGFLEKYAKECF